MFYPVHHIPCRLRIKSPLIKGDGVVAAALRAHLKAVAGVETIETNPTTGSAIIKYSRYALSATAILEDLNRWADQSGLCAPEEKTGAQRALIVQRLAETMLRAVVHSAIERSAVALLAALI